MKLIQEEVATCAACPYCELTACELTACDCCVESDICLKFQISFNKWYIPGNFNIMEGIHPDCRLKDV